MNEKINKWLSLVCEYFSIDRDTLLGRSGGQLVADARKVAMYLLHYNVGLTYTLIGEMFDGRDRSGVCKSTANIDIGYVNAVKDLEKTKRQERLAI